MRDTYLTNYCGLPAILQPMFFLAIHCYSWLLLQQCIHLAPQHLSHFRQGADPWVFLASALDVPPLCPWHACECGSIGKGQFEGFTAGTD